MGFRRGFKAEAERISSEVRGELGLGATDTLDPFGLATHLGVPVYSLGQLRAFCANPIFVKVFSVEEQDSFSAMTVFVGTQRIIIHNESHARTRQVSNVAHEISHCLLEHPPARISSSGCRHWERNVEDEATWLGAALLVPRAGALQLALRGCGVAEIAGVFGVSESLCRWRVAQTGIAVQLQRRRRFDL